MARRKNETETETGSAPSRSALKRAARDIENLARQLAELAPATLNRLEVDEDLRHEIDQVRATKGYGARDRQIRHLAAVLRRREDAVESLQAFIADLEGGRRSDAEAFHQLEELRERLCDPHLFPAALADAESRWPHLDTGALTRLARSVHTGGDKRAFREIFRLLRTTSEEQR
jgi:ribosome-associated protein